MVEIGVNENSINRPLPRLQNQYNAGLSCLSGKCSSSLITIAANVISALVALRFRAHTSGLLPVKVESEKGLFVDSTTLKTLSVFDTVQIFMAATPASDGSLADFRWLVSFSQNVA